jgi:lipopolysaccharide transport system ATP-binding protein
MIEPVIQVKSLSKFYQIRSTVSKRYQNLRDDVVDGLKALFRGQLRRDQTEDFWALKDINFDVNQGEVVGIIGRNGAGKSTLLKILSRIVPPTTGEIIIRGRIGSLLEVGTGFHPELTGRENIFMNGAILGMKRAEIYRKFDEIVAFSEVEKFLDTPVKFYSSGMYVRLAFAVAAHLEPEILIVDEVLAVGDAAFQKKCLGKMEDVAEKEGKTVLFVSHNMAAITTLCQKAVWIDGGRLQEFSNDVEAVISSYLQKNTIKQASSDRYWKFEDAPGNENIKIQSLKVLSCDGTPNTKINIRTPIKLEFVYHFLLDEILFYFGCHVLTISGEIAFVTTSKPEQMKRGVYKSTVLIPGGLLNNHHYTTHLYWVKDGHIVLYEVENLLSFEIQDIEREFGAWLGSYLGTVRPKLAWTTERIE